MRLSTLRWSCLCALLAVVAACSDDTNPNPNPNPYPTPDGSTMTPDAGGMPDPDGGTADTGTGSDGSAEIDAICADYAQLECTRDKACFPIFVDWAYGSFEACLVQAKETCRVWSALPGSSLSAGRILSCAQAYGAAGCDPSGPLQECLFLPGDLANTGACHLNDQCSSGHCRKAGISDCGACADKLPEGAACAKADECQTGRCSAGLCEPILKEGQACAASTDCFRNLVCYEDICQKIAIVGEGDLCGGATQCRPSMSCVSGRCFKDRVVDVGQKCGEIEDVGFAFCRNGDCNAQSICVNRPALGAACSETGSCAGTGVCIQGQCRALAPDVCDVPPRQGALRELVGKFDRAALARQAERARPAGRETIGNRGGRAERPGG